MQVQSHVRIVELQMLREVARVPGISDQMESSKVGPFILRDPGKARIIKKNKRKVYRNLSIRMRR